jgi:hypothetical protein
MERREREQREEDQLREAAKRGARGEGTASRGIGRSPPKGPKASLTHREGRDRKLSGRSSGGSEARGGGSDGGGLSSRMVVDVDDDARDSRKGRARSRDGPVGGRSRESDLYDGRGRRENWDWKDRIRSRSRERERSWQPRRDR